MHLKQSANLITVNTRKVKKSLDKKLQNKMCMETKVKASPWSFQSFDTCSPHFIREIEPCALLHYQDKKKEKESQNQMCAESPIIIQQHKVLLLIVWAGPDGLLRSTQAADWETPVEVISNSRKFYGLPFLFSPPNTICTICIHALNTIFQNPFKLMLLHWSSGLRFFRWEHHYLC